MDDIPRKVLLIEDKLEVVSVIRHLAADCRALRGLELKSVSRLPAALSLLEAEAFDAVILDLVLPCGGGVELYLKIKQVRPETPVVVLTTLQDEEIARKAVSLGAMDYLVLGMLEARLLERALAYAVKGQRLLRSARDAQRRAELKSDLMSNVSHELRNPLATVKAAVTFVKEGLAGPVTLQQRRLIEMACRNVDREVRMLDNILDLSRLQSGKAAIARQRVELKPLVEEIVQEHALSAPAGRIDVEVPAEAAASGDRDMVGQVIRNLLDNAARFARSRVSVRAAPQADALVVSVADDGVGIPKTRLPDLFTRFVQLAREPGGGGYKGTGLGLAICREIVEAHGGKVWAESSPGKGSRFSFSIAAWRQNGTAAPPSHLVHK